MLATPTYLLPNRVTCIPGYDKLLVATLFDPTSNHVTVTLNGVTYTSGTNFTLTARGSPTVCWTGTITPSLPVGTTRYPWTVSQTVAGVTYTDSGSMMPIPGAADKVAVFFNGCDNNTNFSNAGGLKPWKVPGSWQYQKTYATDTSKLPVAGMVFHDDLGYVDNLWIDDGSPACTYLSLPGLTGLFGTNTPATSGALNDYLLGWCAIAGMLGPTDLTGANLTDVYLLYVLWGRESNRAWCRKNINVWPQWGDHEFMDDMGWDNQPGGATLNQWTNGKAAWDAFYGALQPPLNGVAARRDAAARHWAIKIGSAVIVSLDGITNAAKVSSWATPSVPNGGLALGTSATLTQFTTIYGNNQIDDILEAVNTLAGDCTVLSLAHSLRYLVARTNSTPPEAFTISIQEADHGAQHPIYDHCLADYQRLFTAIGNAPKSLMDNPRTNGTVGSLVVVSGDFHFSQVLQMQRAAYTGNAAENFTFINHGTTNGSAYMNSVAPEAVIGGTVANCYVDYSVSANTPENFHATRFEIRPGTFSEVLVRHSDMADSTEWQKKFYPRSANYAFPADFALPRITRFKK